MRKINFNTYVHSKTANRFFFRPQYHVDDIYDMRRSCCVRWKTSGRRRGCLRSLLIFLGKRRGRRRKTASNPSECLRE